MNDKDLEQFLTPDVVRSLRAHLALHEAYQPVSENNPFCFPRSVAHVPIADSVTLPAVIAECQAIYRMQQACRALARAFTYRRETDPCLGDDQ